MILVIGGMASGKRTYVQSLGLDDEHVVFNLEERLREAPLLPNVLEELAQCDAVVCTEVGMGVVPIDADERAWRELVGRTCCLLAQRANKVVRMVCGIPVVIASNDVAPSDTTSNENR